MLGKVRKYFQSWDMTFEQFERQVNMLNFRCRRLIDSNGNYVKFTVLTNDFVFNDMLFWKLLVKVRCDMVKLDEREPEKSVVVSFIRFLGICDFVNDFLSKPVVKAGQDKVGSSVGVDIRFAHLACISGLNVHQANVHFVLTDALPKHASDFDAAENFVQN
ncbi:Alanine--tRNA ligase [Trichinella spiralis]|uniref:Alanine--tRNA ligase n=1 Tax=Trichinella spiralis TaxID=6334 RepID=A0ABR3KF38_TRISP